MKLLQQGQLLGQLLRVALKLLLLLRFELFLEVVLQLLLHVKVKLGVAFKAQTLVRSLLIAALHLEQVILEEFDGFVPDVLGGCS